MSSDTRQKILAATRELMEDRRGRGVRMSDIARTAGVSRQALYLHFENRADLLIAATRYVDELTDIEGRLAPSRAATAGRDRLVAFTRFWAGQLEIIRPMALALLAMEPSDEEAARAWRQSMENMREGCEAVMAALERDRDLAEPWTVETATDLYWAMLSFRTWHLLISERGWTQEDYIARTTLQAERTFCRRRSRRSGPDASREPDLFGREPS